MADIYQAWDSWADFTITLASLATDSNLLVGRQSTIVDMSSLLSSKVKDVQIAAKITTGTSPTGGAIYLYIFSEALGDTTYPFGAGASDAALTMTNSGRRDQAFLVAAVPVSTTSNITYDIQTQGVAQFYGGYLPKKLGIWVVHNTGVNLNATGSNHQISYRAVKDVVA